ncbi:hypothetical protein THAOC_01165, partial [Thalassiosira oceanica]
GSGHGRQGRDMGGATERSLEMGDESSHRGAGTRAEGGGAAAAAAPGAGRDESPPGRAARGRDAA